MVPLTMPATHSMRLAVRPSRRALMIGMPPATAASKPIITPFLCAAAKISLPCTASKALLAVTTCLPAAMASSTSVLATPVPPISSTTMSIAGSAITRLRVVDHGRGIADDAAGARHVEIGDAGDANAAAGAALDLFLVALQDLEGAAPHRADAQQADLHGFHVLCRFR